MLIDAKTKAIERKRKALALMRPDFWRSDASAVRQAFARLIPARRIRRRRRVRHLQERRLIGVRVRDWNRRRGRRALRRRHDERALSRRHARAVEQAGTLAIAFRATIHHGARPRTIEQARKP